jgi:protein-disulfide isomerase/uncharacterized membrane protein
MKSNVMRRVVWLLTLLLCAAGVYVSFELSQRHIQGGYGADSLLGRLCEDGTASCDQVIKSPWGTFKGVPTAVWGLLYFTGVGLWCLLVGLPNRAGRWWQLLPIAGTLVGLAIAAYLDYVMFAKLPAWCPLCLVTHVISLLLFAGSILMWPWRPRAPLPATDQGQAGEVPQAPPAPVPVASPQAGRVVLSCVAILIAAVALHENFLMRHHRAEEEEARAMMKRWTAAATQPVRAAVPAALAVRPDDPVLGDSNSPDTIVLFSDFECPACGGFAAFWKKDVEPYAAGKVRLVYRYFPMNTKCNSAIGSTLHELSCEAAEMAEAARLQGGNAAFWKIHDALFINQLLGKKRLSPAELAKKVGLDPVRFEKDRTSERVRRRIQADIELGRQVGVRATPVVFLNGERRQFAPPDPGWQRFLASLRGTPSPAVAEVGRPGGSDSDRATLAECRNQLTSVIDDWQSLAREFMQTPALSLALRPDDPAKGNPKARRTVVVFSDFECPRSRAFAAYWRNHVDPYVKDKARLVFRYFPMNTNCNPTIRRTLYAKACEAAAAAEAARIQGGNEAFWKMHDELFDNQYRQKPLSYTEMAKKVGLDVGRFEKDMNGPDVRDRIQQDISFAQQAEVKGTPTVFLNGRLVHDWSRDRFWQYLLDFTPKPQPTTPGASAPVTSRPAVRG